MNAWILAVLTTQVYAAWVTFGVGVLVVGGALFLIGTSSGGAGDDHAAKDRVYGVRKFYFWLLCVVLVAGLFMTLRHVPYAEFQGKPDAVVTVVGMQWSWKMALGESEVKPLDFTGSNELTLSAGKLVTFQVKSADVNHNFAIYDSKGTLLAQTQAMPGYRNDLQYRFREKGDYPVVCLEYCGAPHTVMTGVIHVL